MHSMNNIKYCTTLNLHIAKQHPEKIKSLRLWYWLKLYCTANNIRDGKIYIKAIPFYTTQKGLEKILKDNTFWNYKTDKYSRFNERYLIIKSFKRIMRENNLDRSHIKRLYFRRDKPDYLSTLKMFKAFITKSEAELPIRKKNKRDKVGRSFSLISKKTGFSDRTVIRHLKFIGVRRKKQSEYVENCDNKFAIYNSFEEATQNYGNIKNYDILHHKIFLEKQQGGRVAFKEQLPNFYKFTGIEITYLKNPIHQLWGRSAQAKSKSTHQDK